ncbi:hypothetical protein HY085_03065 [Candidatus Gottesmanbacteria bacterium]|nr:hypothetical protein [Candidatus Gottesmanbacteria bacterium]
MYTPQSPWHYYQVCELELKDAVYALNTVQNPSYTPETYQVPAITRAIESLDACEQKLYSLIPDQVARNGYFQDMSLGLLVLGISIFTRVTLAGIKRR